MEKAPKSGSLSLEVKLAAKALVEQIKLVAALRAAGNKQLEEAARHELALARQRFAVAQGRMVTASHKRCAALSEEISASKGG